jgi:hypothetical protein
MGLNHGVAKQTVGQQELDLKVNWGPAVERKNSRDPGSSAFRETVSLHGRSSNLWLEEENAEARAAEYLATQSGSLAAKSCVLQSSGFQRGYPQLIHLQLAKLE